MLRLKHSLCLETQPIWASFKVFWERDPPILLLGSRSRGNTSRHHTTCVCLEVFLRERDSSSKIGAFLSQETWKDAHSGCVSWQRWEYQDSARLLCESCWQKKLRGHWWKKIANREIVVEWTVGVREHTGSWLKAQICAILEPNTNAQRLSFLSLI